MEIKILVFFAILSSCLAATDLDCPGGCHCKSYKYNGGIANCPGSILNRPVHFPDGIAHLKISNWETSHGLILKDRIFLDMNLENLESINIVNSSVTTIHFNAFHGLKKLKDLDFSHNQIQSLDPDTFLNVKSLEQLVLTGNPISLQSFQGQNGRYFLNSDSITDLYLIDCGIKSIPSRVFSNIRNLENINLSGNELKEINGDAFDKLGELESIDLSDNKISKLDKNAFINLYQLTVLSLRGNPIKTIEGIDIENLQILDVSNCDLEILMADTFAGIPDLHNLNLSRNSIRDINKETFTDLISLTYLDLSHNNIRGPLDMFLFENNQHLETLSFADNKELVLFPGFSNSFSSLYKLDLSNCGIRNLTVASFKGMPYIDSLNISGNELTHLSSKTFNYLNHLTVLDISRNKLHSLNNKIFFSNTHLHKLFMSHNYFTSVPAILFANVPTLSWLDMSNNRISKLWNISESFVMKNKNIFGKLNYLNVSGNRLIALHMHSFISMRTLEALDISNNPIICTQDFSYVMQWLIGKKVEPSLKARNSQFISLINNNIQWEKILNQICPINFVPTPNKKTKHKSEALMTKLKNEIQRNSISEITELPEEGLEDLPIVIHPVTEPESSLIWPIVLIWVSILSILIAVGNLVAILICRCRKSHSETTYTPGPGSLNGHFLVRRGGRSVYKKLYAECSEPAQIHASNKTSKFITILGFPQTRNNSSV